MQRRILKRLTLITAAAVLLGACEGQMGTKDDEGMAADVVEGSMDAAADEATTQGMADEGVFQGHPLDDPSSPLSQRTIYFAFDSSHIEEENRSIIEAHAEWLARHPGANALEILPPVLSEFGDFVGQPRVGGLHHGAERQADGDHRRQHGDGPGIEPRGQGRRAPDRGGRGVIGRLLGSIHLSNFRIAGTEWNPAPREVIDTCDISTLGCEKSPRPWLMPQANSTNSAL